LIRRREEDAMNEPVLVAGAGPVGMSAAMALKRLGVDVRIIDKNTGRTDKSKALVLWPRTLELLAIQGCATAFVDAGLKGRGARITADGRELVHVSFDTARSVYPFPLYLPQSETERLLDEELSRLGVHVERQVTLRSFADDGAGVTATLDHADGRTEALRASYLVGCDGAHSTVRHGLDLAFAGATEQSQWVLADVRIEGKLDPYELIVCWKADGILVLFPIDHDRFRVVADVDAGPAEPEQEPTMAEIQSLLDARGPPGLRAHDPFWLSRFHINERKVRDYRKGRVFVAGDAAHVHSPAGGQGMNTGMQDAFNLAWKLAMVWHGRANGTLLDSYSPERSAIGDQVLKNAAQMTRVGILRNPILQEIRNAAVSVLGHLPLLRQRLVDQLTEVDLNYEHGPLTQHPHGASSGPRCGYRAPDIQLSSAQGQLNGILATGRFAVLAVDAPALALPGDLAALAVSAQATATNDYTGGHRYLIRPDGYVALSTAADDEMTIPTYLRRLM
jgi:2-polyprenyl-6-methoxyphenol hydroxylase-like FAD-dependent oxidoreductase